MVSVTFDSSQSNREEPLCRLEVLNPAMQKHDAIDRHVDERILPPQDRELDRTVVREVARVEAGEFLRAKVRAFPTDCPVLRARACNAAASFLRAVVSPLAGSLAFRLGVRDFVCSARDS